MAEQQRRLPAQFPFAVVVALPGVYLGAADYLGWRHPELPAPLAVVIIVIIVIIVMSVLYGLVAIGQFLRRWRDTKPVVRDGLVKPFDELAAANSS